MNRYLKWGLQAILFYVGLIGLQFGMMLIIVGMTGGLDEMLSYSLETWWNLFITMNLLFFGAVFVIGIIVGFLVVWEKASKIHGG